jgi:hypothetical protein
MASLYGQQLFGIIVQSFIVEPLAKHQIAATFPLIREALPKLDVAGWTRLARRLTDPRRAHERGILVARRNQRQHACGLFYYRKELDLQHGEILMADHFVAVDLLDPRPVVAALIEALEKLAYNLECAAIRSVVHASSSDIASELFSAGHYLEGATLWKTLPPLTAADNDAPLFPILIAEESVESDRAEES